MSKTPIEESAALPAPAADDVAGRFPAAGAPALVPDAERAALLSDLHFGEVFSDHMARAVWQSSTGWSEHRLEAFGPKAISPAASVLHYGQEVFEGLKAYRHEDGSVWTFRPTWNAARLNASARRMALPEIPVEDFLASIVDLVRKDEAWVPTGEGSSLYLRPFMYASEPFLGVRAAKTVVYDLIASPCGPYFKGGFHPVSIWVTDEYHRAAVGGTGAAKTSGNYAASLLPQLEAAERGFDQVCYLDSTNTYLEELGGMNVFVVGKDGTVRTPALTGTILEGCTRNSIIQLLRDRGVDVREEHIALDWLAGALESGEVTEMFACGTAAVVTAIGRLAGRGFDVRVGDGEPGELTQSIYTELTSIQLGKLPDKHGWLYKLV
ncbi:MAG: branched-chain amino acid aminotransferase [Buchananella hordeovulneris]|nr:branched-chain amino acid aminotransferase [Buchananella hordeovulneris]